MIMSFIPLLKKFPNAVEARHQAEEGCSSSKQIGVTWTKKAMKGNKVCYNSMHLQYIYTSYSNRHCQNLVVKR